MPFLHGTAVAFFRRPDPPPHVQHGISPARTSGFICQTQYPQILCSSRGRLLVALSSASSGWVIVEAGRTSDVEGLPSLFDDSGMVELMRCSDDEDLSSLFTDSGDAEVECSSNIDLSSHWTHNLQR